MQGHSDLFHYHTFRTIQQQQWDKFSTAHIFSSSVDIPELTKIYINLGRQEGYRQ